VKYLLDNDVFLAAIYRGHSRHGICRAWLDSRKSTGWGIASETYLAGVRLLMNPAVMGAEVFSSEDALNAVETELAGSYQGQVVVARKKPDRRMLEKAQGHKQVMDCWLVQIAREAGAKLATSDGGLVTLWPELTEKVDASVADWKKA